MRRRHHRCRTNRGLSGKGASFGRSERGLRASLIGPSTAIQAGAIDGRVRDYRHQSSS